MHYKQDFFKILLLCNTLEVWITELTYFWYTYLNVPVSQTLLL